MCPLRKNWWRRRPGLAWAGRHPDQAARIASDYWNQPVDLVRHALTPPYGQVIYDRFVPKTGELQVIADLMVRYNLIGHADISGLVDDRFALAASTDGVEELESIVRVFK